MAETDQVEAGLVSPTPPDDPVEPASVATLRLSGRLRAGAGGIAGVAHRNGRRFRRGRFRALGIGAWRPNLDVRGPTVRPPARARAAGRRCRRCRARLPASTARPPDARHGAEGSHPRGAAADRPIAGTRR